VEDEKPELAKEEKQPKSGASFGPFSIWVVMVPCYKALSWSLE